MIYSKQEITSMYHAKLLTRFDKHNPSLKNIELMMDFTINKKHLTFISDTKRGVGYIESCTQDFLKRSYQTYFINLICRGLLLKEAGIKYCRPICGEDFSLTCLKGCKYESLWISAKHLAKHEKGKNGEIIFTMKQTEREFSASSLVSDLNLALHEAVMLQATIKSIRDADRTLVDSIYCYQKLNNNCHCRICPMLFNKKSSLKHLNNQMIRDLWQHFTLNFLAIDNSYETYFKYSSVSLGEMFKDSLFSM